ncbi:MAG: sensor histidine kinase, partial [Hyphomicrobiales bacterium]
GSDSETLQVIARLIRGETAPETSLEARAPGEAVSAAPADLSLLQGLLDALPVGLLLARDGHTLHVNQTFALAFGYRNAADVMTAGGLEAVFPDDAYTIANGPAFTGAGLRVTGRSRSGRSLDMPVTVQNFAGGDGAILKLVLLRPVPTPEAEAPAPAATAGPEASPRDTEPSAEFPSVQAQLGEAGVDRTDFLAKVSHEVRTPLNSIIGFSELMKEERLGPIGNDRYRSYIRDIHESGLYALSLINDLLDISKISSGNFEINFTAVDLESLAEDCLHVMQPQAQAGRVVLRTDIEGPLPRVLADSRAMKQVLLNLLSNAVKFTGPGGQVIVSARRLESGEVRLRVRDTGIGMSGSEIEQAMRPFRQLDTAPRKQVGTGLGLPLTKALAEANRASFHLESSSGAGTTVDIVFAPDRTAGGGGAS